MGTIADSLFTVLMSWVCALVNAIWALFSSDGTTLLGFLGKHWIAIALVIIAVGLVVDRLVWLIRWRPYHLLAMRVRRLLRIGDPEEEDEAEAPAEDISRFAPPAAQEETYASQPEEENWLPEPPTLDEADEQEAMMAAQSVPDETLGQYPGMRYDSRAAAQAPQEDMEGTRRYAAVHAEGPGAAEVNRRRAEIDAWQLQMQEEARQRAEAERDAKIAAAEAQRQVVQAQAEADLYRTQKEAEARLIQAQKEAEAQYLLAEKEAEAIRMKGDAEAAAMLKKAEAMKEYGQAAMLQMLIDKLPDMARAVGEPLAKTDKIILFGEGGATAMTRDTTGAMLQTFEAVKESVGLDIPKMLRDVTTGGLIGKAAAQQPDASPEAAAQE